MPFCSAVGKKENGLDISSRDIEKAHRGQSMIVLVEKGEMLPNDRNGVQRYLEP